MKHKDIQEGKPHEHRDRIKLQAAQTGKKGDMPPIFWRSTALPYHFLTFCLDLTSRNVRECFLLWPQESHTFITITLSCNNKAWELVSVWVLNYERGQGRRVILNRMIAHYGAQWDRLLFLSIRSPWGKIFKLSAACMPPHTHTPPGSSHTRLSIPVLSPNQIAWASCLNGWGFSVTSGKEAETAGSFLRARLAAHGWIKLMHYSERKICGLWVNFGGVGSDCSAS